MSALVGSADKQLAWVAGGCSAVKSTYFIDFNATKPTAVAGPSLGAAKGYVSISHLPDLTAFETGGGAGYDSPVYEASILNPTSRKLTAMAPPTVGRTYHSSALTMPDGRVVTFGGDPYGDAKFELRVEIYSPPYMFKGTRPTIKSSPINVHYGNTFSLGATAAAGATLSKVVIMRPGSATHSLDANQRLLQLASTSSTGGLQATLPTNPNLAPPGWYLAVRRRQPWSAVHRSLDPPDVSSPWAARRDRVAAYPRCSRSTADSWSGNPCATFRESIETCCRRTPIRSTPPPCTGTAG